MNRFDGLSFKIYETDPDNPFSLSVPFVTCLHQDPTDNSNVIWIGTMGGGINKYDPETEVFTHYHHQENLPNSLSNDFISCIISDQQGNLWIGTHGGGTNFFNPVTEEFKCYRYNPDNPNSISNDDIWTIIQDRDGLIWIGTNGGGLNCFIPDKEIFLHFKNDPDDPASISNNNIYSLCEDDQGKLWIGTTDLLNSLDLKQYQISEKFSQPLKPKFDHYRHDPANPYSISGNLIRKIFKDNTGILWMATNNGLSHYANQDRKFINMSNTTDKSSNNQLRRAISFYDDPAGNQLWIGTDGSGVFKYSRRSNPFTHYYHITGDTLSLGHNVLYQMIEDHDGNIWIVKAAGGFDQFDPETKIFNHHAWPNENPYSIKWSNVSSLREDLEGNLWIGASTGIARYDPATRKFLDFPDRHFYERTGNRPQVNSLLVDSADNENFLWIGTFANGLIKYYFEKTAAGSIYRNPMIPNPSAVKASALFIKILIIQKGCSGSVPIRD